MDFFEIKKTRLNFILKLFYPFVVVLGALFVHFDKVSFNDLNYGGIVLLGLTAFLIVLLFTMIRYIFYELWYFKKDDKLATAFQTKVDNTYNNIFNCFLNGGIGLIIYIVVFVMLMMDSSKAFEYINPSKIHVIISLIISLLFSSLPIDLVLLVCGFKRKIDITSNMTSEQMGDKKFEFPIVFEKIKQFQWPAWCILVFNILFIVWFK